MSVFFFAEEKTGEKKLMSKSESHPHTTKRNYWFVERINQTEQQKNHSINRYSLINELSWNDLTKENEYSEKNREQQTKQNKRKSSIWKISPTPTIKSNAIKSSSSSSLNQNNKKKQTSSSLSSALHMNEWNGIITACSSKNICVFYAYWLTQHTQTNKQTNKHHTHTRTCI